ncbi:MAG: HTH-type transcriptional activator AllS [Betaproteobacteria bacterium]
MGGRFSDDKVPDSLKVKLDQEMLRTFLAVARLRSFSAAADLLYKSTSAISYRIKLLEDNLGTPLFQRTTRVVTLTPSGEYLYEKASQIFDWLQTLPNELKQMKEGIEPHFNLIINNLLYRADNMTLLLSHLAEKFPYTAFNVRRGVYMGVWDQMLHNGGQMALGAPGFDTIHDDFVTQPLGFVNWAFVVAPNHPLASAKEPLDNDALRVFPAINVEDTSLRISKRTAWKLPRQRELLVPDMQTKIACHVAGLGVGFLPVPIAHDLQRQQKLVELHVVAGRAPSPLSCAWRRSGSGQITNYLRDLILSKNRIIQPFLSPIDSVI